ncbi:MAG: hypothetical protein Q4C40_05595 [Eubacteriales bacterium]|nr:hypothetical protein [Eubacteriales bacterium]
MKKRCMCIGSLLFLLLLCRYSTNCAEAVRSALQLCLTSAIPSLFPFFAASSLAISCGLAQSLGILFSPVMRRCFHLPGCGAAALFLGFLGGYPAGARMATELWHSKLCTREEAEALAAVCNNTGPAFLIGMCGCGLFHSLALGLFLYTVHILSALLTAFLLRPKTLPVSVSSPNLPEELPFCRLLTQSVLSAGRSCLMISAFILFFSVILCLLRLTGVLSAACSSIAPLFHTIGLSASGTQSVFTGCMELTQGLAGLTESAGSIPARLTAVSFLCAFGGCSVLFQTAAAVEGMRVSQCIRGKCIHACLSALLCVIFLCLLSFVPFF